MFSVFIVSLSARQRGPREFGLPTHPLDTLIDSCLVSFELVVLSGENDFLVCCVAVIVVAFSGAPNFFTSIPPATFFPLSPLMPRTTSNFSTTSTSSSSSSTVNATHYKPPPFCSSPSRPPPHHTEKSHRFYSFSFSLNSQFVDKFSLSVALGEMLQQNSSLPHHAEELLLQASVEGERLDGWRKIQQHTKKKRRFRLFSTSLPGV